MTYELNAHCTNPKNMAQIYSGLHRNILDVFNEYGVAIMTPSYEADPPEAKLVPKDPWYAEPAARPKTGSDSSEELPAGSSLLAAVIVGVRAPPGAGR